MTQIFRILIIISLLIFLPSCKSPVDKHKELASVCLSNILKNNPPKQINNIEYIACQKNNAQKGKFLNNNKDKSLSIAHNTPVNNCFQYEAEYVRKKLSPAAEHNKSTSSTPSTINSENTSNEHHVIALSNSVNISNELKSVNAGTINIQIQPILSIDKNNVPETLSLLIDRQVEQFNINDSSRKISSSCLSIEIPGSISAKQPYTLADILNNETNANMPSDKNLSHRRKISSPGTALPTTLLTNDAEVKELIIKISFKLDDKVQKDKISSFDKIVEDMGFGVLLEYNSAEKIERLYPIDICSLPS